MEQHISKKEQNIDMSEQVDEVYGKNLRVGMRYLLVSRHVLTIVDLRSVFLPGGCPRHSIANRSHLIDRDQSQAAVKMGLFGSLCNLTLLGALATVGYLSITAFEVCAKTCNTTHTQYGYQPRMMETAVQSHTPAVRSAY